jgi:hypothetical protein
VHYPKYSFALRVYQISITDLIDKRGYDVDGPIPVDARSKAWFCGRSIAAIVGLNPAGAWMSVFCE